MSTRLERAEKLAKAKKLHPSKHREIVIAARNDEIFALKARLREADKEVRQLRHELEVCRAVTALCCQRYQQTDDYL